MWWPWSKKPPPKLVWTAQFASKNAQDNNLLHFAKGNSGFYEIYANYEALEFLVSYPKSSGMPADLFADLGRAKAKCDVVNSHTPLTPPP